MIHPIGRMPYSTFNKREKELWHERLQHWSHLDAKHRLLYIQYVHLQALRDDTWEEFQKDGGKAVVATANGEGHKRHPALNIIRELDKDIRQLMQMMGVTPTTLPKTAANPDSPAATKPENKFLGGRKRPKPLGRRGVQSKNTLTQETVH